MVAPKSKLRHPRFRASTFPARSPSHSVQKSQRHDLFDIFECKLALPTANRNAKSKIMLSLLLFALIQNPSAAQPPPDPFAPLAVYNGTWTVHADHPWSGAAPGTPGNPTLDHLVSRCQRFTLYFACEQTVNGKTQALLVYTVGSSPGKFHCRFISPDGLAGGRGDLTLDGNHWTYLDKPPPTLKGNWSRVENFILDHDHIRFEECESADEGKTWTKPNSGTEERAPQPGHQSRLRLLTKRRKVPASRVWD